MGNLLMLNLIAFIVCVIAAAYQIINDNITFFILDLLLAIMQIPFVIRWFKK